MCDKNHTNSSLSFLVGAMIGGLVGAATGLLTAPSSGEVTRRKIRKTGEEYIEIGKDALEEGIDYVEDVRDQVEDTVNPLLKDAHRKIKKTLLRVERAEEHVKKEFSDKVNALVKEVETKLDMEKGTLKKRLFNGTSKL